MSDESSAGVVQRYAFPAAKALAAVLLAAATGNFAIVVYRIEVLGVNDIEKISQFAPGLLGDIQWVLVVVGGVIIHLFFVAGLVLFISSLYRIAQGDIDVE